MSDKAIEIALRLAKQRGWNQSQLAARIDATSADITNWKTRGMPAERHIPVAKALGISVEELTGHFTPAEQAMRRAAEGPAPEYAGTVRLRLVPVVGTARMGDDGFYDEISSVPGAGDGHVEIATRDPNAYGLRVRGMSMFPAIRDGWYVLVEPNSPPREGEYILIKLQDGRKMVKELLFRRPDSIEIMSVNGEHRFRLENSDIDGIQAVAAVVSPSKWRPD